MASAAQKSVFPAISAAREPGKYIEPPQFIIHWESWTRQFLGRLADQFRRQPLPLQLTSRPAHFWPDVFVPGRKSGRGLAISALYHAAALAFLYLVPTLILLSQSPRFVDSELSDRRITYYKVSEYLPEIRSQSAPAKIARKAEPKLAPQRVVSVPLRADNREQTILNPPNVRLLPQHVALPNMVVSTPVLAPPRAIPGAAPRLVFPFAPPQVVAPAVQVNGEQLAKLKAPNLPMPSVIQPPVNVDLKPRMPGEINIAGAEVEGPKLPAPEQKASGSGEEQTANKAATAVPAAPAITGGTAASAAGQLLALGLNPASVEGPIPVPNGNRHGEFAAGPEGKPDAAGAPELKAGGRSSGGAGKSAGEGTGNSGAPGISVALPPPNVPTSLSSSGDAVAQVPSPVAVPPRVSEPQQIARLEPPHLPAVSAPGEGLESQVFGGKKYYSLTLNMPNLTSAGGSWIIRFAELAQAPVSSAAFARANTVVPEGELTAPVAVEKVDPAYPPDLMADRIEGVVTLYAVIHSDGTVSDIHVLRSVEDRLDHNAIHALEQWRFRPATRNGAPVDLEAVVQIPFRLRKTSF